MEAINELKKLLENAGEVPNKDLFEQFIEEAQTDDQKARAIERFMAEAENIPTEKVFENLSIYELNIFYEDIQDEEA